MTARVVVAGIGNVFLGDDAFGVAVARALADRRLGDHVEVRDVGIAGLHLAYDLVDGPELAVLVDVAELDAPAGTVALVEPAGGPSAVMSGHGVDVGGLLATMAGLGGRTPRVLLVGCQPSRCEPGAPLSPEVERAVPVACRLVEDVISREAPPCSAA